MNGYYIINVDSSNVEWIGFQLTRDVMRWLAPNANDEGVDMIVCVKFKGDSDAYFYNSNSHDFWLLLNAKSTGVAMGVFKKKHLSFEKIEIDETFIKKFSVNKSDLKTCDKGFIHLIDKILLDPFRTFVKIQRPNIAIDQMYAF